MTPDQHERLGKLGFVKGDQQEMCKRVYNQVRTKDGRVYARVLSTDMAIIKDALERGDTGAWQDLLREIMEGSSGG